MRQAFRERGVLRPLGLAEVSITGGFWAQRQATNGRATLDHGREWMDKLGWTGALELRVAGKTGTCSAWRSAWWRPPQASADRTASPAPAEIHGVLSRLGEDDAVVRPYRHGDDLRKVHWRSTARRDELMVRVEERPWRGGTTVLLDHRLVAHRGSGPGASLEWAVSLAASICLHLHRYGHQVRLVGEPVLDRQACERDRAQTAARGLEAHQPRGHLGRHAAREAPAQTFFGQLAQPRRGTALVALHQRVVGGGGPG